MNDDEPANLTFSELIEHSSLGTPGAKALRAQCPPEVREEILAGCRLESRLREIDPDDQ
jgi:hypothetical protein